ncbi:hypothetical protein Lser_V15G28421 [Lactuca serriola]
MPPRRSARINSSPTPPPPPPPIMDAAMFQTAVIAAVMETMAQMNNNGSGGGTNSCTNGQSQGCSRVGDGNEETVDESFIRIPDDMDIKYTNKANSVDALIDAIIPSLQFNEDDSKFIISRVILTTKNESVDEINDQMIERFSGEKKVCYSYDEAEDYSNNLYLTKFLNSLNVSGLPPHYLWLKIGCPMILLRNIDPSNGLQIVVGQHAGKNVFWPRIPLCLSNDDMLPFKLKRKKFPLRLVFSMTINKSQGQTIPNMGVYLPESVFSHDQLYVALSRGISRVDTKVLVKPEKRFDHDAIYTSNVVYKEVLYD